MKDIFDNQLEIGTVVVYKVSNRDADLHFGVVVFNEEKLKVVPITNRWNQGWRAGNKTTISANRAAVYDTRLMSRNILGIVREIQNSL